ncbi:MAG TPA: VWA domain-containing protein [Thermoanaerobaculia bacterium]|nr:VWA domain-containing protein [Thermoanaerobaculia bacterium]
MLRTTLALLLALPQSGFQESIEVRIHNVDVVVTNAQGEPVTGLRKSDFELREDGVVQSITNFAAYEGLPGHTIESTEDAPVPESASVIEEKPAPPPARTFIFYIDELSLDDKTQKSVMENLAKFVESAMREGDLAEIVRPAEVTRLVLDPTPDRDTILTQLHDALAESRLSAQRTGLEREMYRFERELASLKTDAEARSISKMYADRVATRVMQRLGTLRSIVASLAPLSGRKVVVAVTQSISAQPGREFYERYLRKKMRASAFTTGGGGGPAPADTTPASASEKMDELFPPSQLDNAERARGMANLKPAIEEVARTASSNGVTLYFIRPENDMPLRSTGTEITSIGLADWNSGSNAPSKPASGTPGPGGVDNSMSETVLDAVANTNATVTPLVDITGGRQYRPNDNLVDAVREIESDLTNFYSLAYSARGGFDKPHKIEVRVKNHPELRVRARNEVVRKSAPAELTDLVSAALILPEAANELGITVRESPAGEKKDLVLEILIPMAALDFERVGDVYRARYSAHYAVTGRVADYASGIHSEQVIEVPAAEWESARVKHWTHVVTIQRRLKDSYRVAVGIRDIRSQQYGIATLDVDGTGGND